MSDSDLIRTDIEGYLKKHENKELLRFVTIGSVDDGKSTLIGRLLHDTESVYEDQMQAIRKTSAKKGDGEALDLSLITDGLKAEREQGITIDVAYRYFSTDKRKFIIADTPGHEQYTRNMATGASTAHVAIILIDARLGILPQSRRHAYIANLLGIPNLVIAVNKMDLRDYDEEVFQEIRKKFLHFLDKLDFQDRVFFPISALKGDNIVSKSPETPWFEGTTILDYLETVPIGKNINLDDFCLPVQSVIRPDLHFRGYAGSVVSGLVHVGDEVQVLPSRKSSRVKEIFTPAGEKDLAFAQQAVTLTLEDEVDVSRGDVFVHPKHKQKVSKNFEAMLVWMHETPLSSHHTYWIKHLSKMTNAHQVTVIHKINMTTLEPESAKTLVLNEIGTVSLVTMQPLVCAAYTESRMSGAFILVDRLTNATVAAGMISAVTEEQLAVASETEEMAGADRAVYFQQTPCVVHFPENQWVLARRIERQLLEQQHPCAVVTDLQTATLLADLGWIALLVSKQPPQERSDIPPQTRVVSLSAMIQVINLDENFQKVWKFFKSEVLR